MDVWTDRFDKLFFVAATYPIGRCHSNGWSSH